MAIVKVLLVLVVAFLGTAVAAFAQTAAPSPSPSPGFSVHGTGANVFLTQSTHGPGTTPPEAPAYLAGEPIAPISPYDWFSTAPLVPGNAGELQYLVTATMRERTISTDLTFALTGLDGDRDALSYWGEPFAGQLDPHEGRSPIGGLVAFPTSAGHHDIGAGQIELPYAASMHANDGSWNVAAGFVDPASYDGFVFTPPAEVTVAPSLGEQTFETLGSGLPSLQSWSPSRATLPLLGADASMTCGHYTFETTDALLPAPAGSAARMAGGTIVLDRGDLGRYSFDVVRVTTGGDPMTIPTLFGNDPSLHPGPQGSLSTSTLAYQRQTIAGVRALVHPMPGDDVLVELGRAWYDAGPVDRPGSSAPGNYEHVALVRHVTDRVAVGADYYRFDPHYASMYLPYGTTEDLWGTAWAFPGPWLKGAYQLVGDNVAQINRAGVRLHADAHRKRLEVHVALSEYRQLQPSTMDNLTSTGFVEVEFLPQLDSNATLGYVRDQLAYVAWHLDRDVASIDFSRDALYRDVRNGASDDLVAMQYPQLVVQEQHTFSNRVIGVVGYGRYAASGMWGTTPVGERYGLGYIGTEIDLGHGQQLFVQLRQEGLAGMPSIPGGPLPTFRGTGLTVEHRISF